MRELSMREMGSIFGGEMGSGGAYNGGGSGGGSSGGSDRGGGSNNGSSGGSGGSGLSYLGYYPDTGMPKVHVAATNQDMPTTWATLFKSLTYAQNQAYANSDPVYAAQWNSSNHASSDGGGRPTSGGR